MNQNEQDNLNKAFEQWSGFRMEGTTKSEMMAHIKSIHWTLECELDSEKRRFEQMVKNLNIPE